MVPLMTSSPTRTATPPRTSGSTSRFRWICRPYSCARAAPEALPLPVAERHRGGDDRDHPVPAARRQLGEGVEPRLQATSPRLYDKADHEALGDRVGPAAQQRAQQLRLGRDRRVPVGQRGAQLARWR